MLDESLDKPIADLIAAAVEAVKDQTGPVDAIRLSAVPGKNATLQVRVTTSSSHGISTTFTRTLNLTPQAPPASA
ncbi:MAG TPA: hypothetical protein VG273_16565 [Bryobacteraceae bacterium]|jgi:hypothetical protein|nr:hypothetical protein [Bryobacteraceae bacterium]